MARGIDSRLFARVVRPITRLFESLPFYPVTMDQLAMLEEDNVCDPAPFFQAFGITPVPFRVGLERMLAP